MSINELELFLLRYMKLDKLALDKPLAEALDDIQQWSDDTAIKIWRWGQAECWYHVTRGTVQVQTATA